MKTMKTRFMTGVFLFAVWCQPLAGQDNNHDTIRDFQLSVIPMIGTDGSETPHLRYRASLNIFAGITGGIEGFEAGGFLNVTNGPVNGFQIAGFGNLVKGDLHGFQGAGFFNVNNGNAQAFRGAGFLNSSTGAFEGFQGAGFLNITGKSFQGFAGAGFANITGGSYQGFAGTGFANVVGGSFQGFAGSGFANVAGGSAQGFMGAGFANVAGGDTQGFQGAGFANLSGGNVSGAQLAGFMNVGKDLEGIQASGFLNVAKKVDGLQLGFINLADTINSGVPVGFLSIVKKGGLMQLEVAGSDVMFVSASFRTGVAGFYNILSFGMRPFSDERFNGFGYGIGTGIGIGKQAALQFELHATQLHESFKWNQEKLDLLNELRLNISVNSGNTLELFAGAVLYNQLSYDAPGHAFKSRNIAPDKLFHENRWDDYLSRWWFGARGGLRINIR